MKKKSKSIPPLLSCSNDILRRAVVAIRDSRGEVNTQTQLVLSLRNNLQKQLNNRINTLNRCAVQLFRRYESSCFLILPTSLNQEIFALSFLQMQLRLTLSRRNTLIRLKFLILWKLTLFIMRPQ